MSDHDDDESTTSSSDIEEDEEEEEEEDNEEENLVNYVNQRQQMQQALEQQIRQQRQVRQQRQQQQQQQQQQQEQQLQPPPPQRPQFRPVQQPQQPQFQQPPPPQMYQQYQQYQPHQPPPQQHQQQQQQQQHQQQQQQYQYHGGYGRQRRRGGHHESDVGDDRVLVATMLQTLGFEKNHIERAIQVYEKNHGTNYNADIITEILIRLQSKDDINQQKEELMRMNLEPKLAAEIFESQFGMKSPSISSAKSDHIHSGDIVLYRNEIYGQVLDKFDEYIQISWPLNKAMYHRAVLWVNLVDIKKEKKKKKKKKEKAKKKIMSLFGSGSGGGKDSPYYSSSKKYKYRYQKLWKNVIVDKEIFYGQKKEKEKEKETEKKKDEKQKIELKMEEDDDEKKMDENKNKKNEKIACKMLETEINDSNAKFLMNDFLSQSGNRYDIETIYKIKNESVNELYEKRKRSILQFSLKNDSKKLNELKLWHILNRNEVFKILNDGFRRKYGKSHSFGFGNLFFQICDYSNIENVRNISYDSDGIKYLLYSSVICGESCMGQQSMNIPPTKKNESYICYETAVNNLNSPKYFITFQDYQAMPLYLLCIKQKKEVIAPPPRSSLKARKRSKYGKKYLAKKYAQKHSQYQQIDPKMLLNFQFQQQQQQQGGNDNNDQAYHFDSV